MTASRHFWKSAPLFFSLILFASMPGRGAEELQFVDITAGENFYCALTDTGRVFCWGENEDGQIGVKFKSQVKQPVEIMGIGEEARAIEAGYSHMCVVTKSGVVKCWGDNKFSQLGNFKGLGSREPVEVEGIGGKVRSISAGKNHTCLLLEGGTVKCWGGNEMGQAGYPRGGKIRQPTEVTGFPAPVTMISSGRVHNCALTEPGEVWCWGNNDNGQLGTGFRNEVQAPVKTQRLEKPVVQVAVGFVHTCAITAEVGEVMCWGANTWAQLGAGRVPDSNWPVYMQELRGEDTWAVEHAKLVTMSEDRTYIIASDGHVRFAGYYQGPVSEKDQRMAYGWAAVSWDFTPPVAGLVKLAAEGVMGRNSSCGIDEKGVVLCWGDGESGKLGYGKALDNFTPTPIKL